MPGKNVFNRISVPTAPAGSKHAYLVFNPSRGVPLYAALETQPASPSVPLPLVRVNSHVLKVALPKTTRGQARVPLVVTSSGEPVELVKVLFGKPQSNRANGDKIIGVVLIDRDGERDEKPSGSRGEARTHFLTPAEFGQALQKFLDDRPKDPLTPHRRYFARLDEQTNPSLLKANPNLPPDLDISPWVNLLTSELSRRLDLRALRYSIGSTDDRRPLAGIAPMLARPVGLISKLQLSLIRKCFPSSDPLGFDLPAYEAAFENFAAGQLRVGLPNGASSTQPSSGYFFLFAEFAFLANAMDIDAKEWSVLANVMTRTQPLYARMYSPRRSAPNLPTPPANEPKLLAAADNKAKPLTALNDTLRDYRPSNYDTEVSQSEIETWKRALANDYLGLSVTELAARAAKNAANAKKGRFAGATTLARV